MPELLPPRPALFLEPLLLRRSLGLEISLCVETFQHTGSFKYRAARNVAASVPNERVITASSGNFGQAIAFACQQAGKHCTVVMPQTSSAVKVENVRGYGAEVVLVDTRVQQREQKVAELAEQSPGAYVASAYDDPLVIEGNASLGREIGLSAMDFDVVVCPIGGGGLAAGLAVGFRDTGCRSALLAAEPLLANDAAQTFRSGEIVTSETESQTVADGARTRSIGRHNWEVLKGSLDGVIEVPEDAIRCALPWLFLEANLKAEPTGCLSVAAVMSSPHEFVGKRVLCVVSGGNVEPGIYASMLGS